MQLSYALKNVLIVLYPEFLGLFVVSLKNYQSLHLIEKEPHLHFFFLMLVLSINLHGLFLYFSNETRALVISRQQPGTQETNRKREKESGLPVSTGDGQGDGAPSALRGVWGP